MPRHLTDDIKRQIEEHITSSMRGADVAKKFDVADCTVSKIWKEYTAKTGIRHKRKYEILKKLTHEQLEEIKQQSHVSSGVLSKKYGVSVARINKIWMQHGVGSNGSGKGHRLTDDERQQIIEMYGKITPIEATRKFKVSPQTIATLWKDKKELNPEMYMRDIRNLPKTPTKRPRKDIIRRQVSSDELDSSESRLLKHQTQRFGKNKTYGTFTRKQLYQFLEKCSNTMVDTNECIQWLGCKGIEENGNNHGKVSIDGQNLWVHACSYLNFVGPLPDHYPSTDAMICHRCIDQGDCVNPRHLYLGTENDNAKDRWAHAEMIKLTITEQQDIIQRQDVPLWTAYQEWVQNRPLRISSEESSEQLKPRLQQDIRNYINK